MTKRAQTARLVRQYTNIAPEERFRLVVRALARDDRAEFEHLCQTCPTKMYRASDAEYSGRLDAAKFVTLIFSVDMARALGKLEMADAVANFAPVISAKVSEMLLRDTHALWTAFETVCREEMSLDLEVVLGAWARPLLESIQVFLKEYNPGSTDSRSTEWASCLTDLWKAEISH